MIDPEAPRFQWGQPVAATCDLFNDGTFPDAEDDALLVPSGGRGEIVQIGAHTETRTTVYLVEFDAGRVIGCFEHEITAFTGARPAAPQQGQPA